MGRSGHVDDLVADVQALKERVGEIEEWAAELAAALRRSAEELRQAAGRLEEADRRYRALLARTEEVERFAADQLGGDVADLRRVMNGIGMSIHVAGGVLMSAAGEDR